MSLTIHLLGLPEILVNGEPAQVRTRKAVALLAYLAVEGRPQSREALISLFWPESDETLGRASLRNALAHIRAALGEYSADCLATHEDQIALSLPDSAEIDTRRVEQAAQIARQLEKAGDAAPGVSESIPILQAGLAAYRGDFLSGISFGGSPDFESWVSRQREAWHQQIGLVCARLFEIQSASGEKNGAIETAGRWLAEDPLNDEACRSLMRAYSAANNRSAALRAYQRFQAYLERELKCAPEADTQALAARLQTVTPPSTVEKPGTTPDTAASLLFPFVGREAEFNQLVSAYFATIRTGARMVAVTGEAGIGKTRLVEEFLQWVQTQGADILSGRAWESGGRVPYQPLVASLRARLETESNLTRLLDKTWLAELARLLPEIREMHPDLPQPVSDETTARQALIEAVARLVGAMAQRRPIVWVLEDLHWSDIATLDLIVYALRTLSHQVQPVLVIVTLRAEAMEDVPNFRNWLAALSREVVTLPIELGGLRRADIAEFLDQLGETRKPAALTEQPHDTLTAWLWDETNGHPLLLTETVSLYLDQQFPFRKVHRGVPPGPWSEAEPAAERTGNEATSSIQRIIQWRMSRLSPSAVDLIRAAAILGRQFSYSTLLRVAELPETSVLGAIDELARARILQMVPPSGLGDDIQYSFTHEKIRALLRSEIPPLWRISLHRRALHTLEIAGAGPAELAYHALAAHEVEAAFRYSLQAGDAALELFATQDAIEYYTHARKLLDERVGPALLKTILPISLIEQLYINLSRAYEIITEWEQARTTYQTLFDIARETRQTVLEWSALNRLAILTAQHSFNVIEAMRLVERALAVAEKSGDPVMVAETEWNLTQMATFTWQPEVALLHGQRALAISREHQLTELTARTLYALGDAYCFAGKWEELVSHLEEALAIYKTLGGSVVPAQSMAAQYIWAGLPPSEAMQLQAMQASCTWQLAEGYIHIGNLPAGIRMAREALAMGNAMQNDWTRAMSCVILCNGLIEAGLFEEAYAIGQEAVSASRNIPNPGMLLFTRSVCGAATQALQQLEPARKMLNDALAIVSSLPVQSYRSYVISRLCMNAVLRSSWQEAYDLAMQSISNRIATPTALIVMDLSRCFEIRALLAHGDLVTARAEVAQFKSRVGANRRYRVSYLECRGALAHGEGDSQQALDCLEQAIALAEEIGLTGELWQLYAALGDILGDSRQPEAAASAHARAREIVAQIAGQIKSAELREGFLASAAVSRIPAS